MFENNHKIIELNHGQQNIIFDLQISKDPINGNGVLMQPTIKFSRMVHEQEHLKRSIILLLDVSGSMNDYNKLANLKTATIKLIEEKIKDDDHFSIVLFNDTTNICLKNSQKKYSKDWKNKINSLKADGGTCIGNALDTIDDTFFEKVSAKNTTIILLSDGQDTSGSPVNVKQKIASLRENITRSSDPQLLNAPPILPILLGDGADSALLRSIGEETHCPVFVNIKDSDDMDRGFKHIAEFFFTHKGIAAGNVHVKIFPKKSVDMVCKNFDFNSPSYDCDYTKVSTFIKPKSLDSLEFDVILTVDNNDLIQEQIIFENCVSYLSVNYDMVEKYVTGKLVEVLDSDDYRSSKIKSLQNALLLLPEAECKTERRAKAREDIVNAIINLSKDNVASQKEMRSRLGYKQANKIYDETYDETYENSKKSIPSSNRGYSETYGGGRNQERLEALKKQQIFDPFAKTLKIGETAYQLISKAINFTQPSWSLLVSIDAAIAQREVITVDLEAQEFKTIYQSLAIAQTDSLENKIKKAADVVKSVFPQPEIEDINKHYLQTHPDSYVKLDNIQNPLPVVPITEYFYKGGLCRHHQILAGYIFGRAVQSKLLPPGSVRLWTGTADNQYAHGWVTYSTQDSLYLIDTTNAKQCFYNIRDSKQLAQVIEEYNGKQLGGILCQILSFYNIAFPENASISGPIDDELIQSIDNDQLFIDAGLVCPISSFPPSNPIRIKGDPTPIFFEESALTQWISKNLRHPVTGAQLKAPILLEPAYDIKNKILALIHFEKGIIHPERGAAPKLNQPEDFSVTTKKSDLQKLRDIATQNFITKKSEQLSAIEKSPASQTSLQKQKEKASILNSNDKPADIIKGGLDLDEKVENIVTEIQPCNIAMNSSEIETSMLANGFPSQEQEEETSILDLCDKPEDITKEAIDFYKKSGSKIPEIQSDTITRINNAELRSENEKDTNSDEENNSEEASDEKWEKPSIHPLNENKSIQIQHFLDHFEDLIFSKKWDLRFSKGETISQPQKENLNVSKVYYLTNNSFWMCRAIREGRQSGNFHEAVNSIERILKKSASQEKQTWSTEEKIKAFFFRTPQTQENYDALYTEFNEFKKTL